ncbi:MAG: lamin tail domain-containing protein [Verrucomicrobiae bacterium]|nr:lamin tail domain-containing protein [Verrucomicrobiae bacterium]
MLPGASCTWTVNSSFHRLRINEILAQNSRVSSTYAGYPDLVELYNDGPEPLDLSGLSLSDDPRLPRKFVFPAGAVIPSCGYLVLAGDNRSGVGGYHMGFRLDATGDSLYLYDNPDRGGRLLDSVSFGLQIPDFSIARFDSDEWKLAYPTLGGPNVACPTGDSGRLRINEWLANRSVYHARDFIELYNPEPLPVAIGGFWVTDEPIGMPNRYVVPSLSFVSAFGFVVLVGDDQAEGTRNRLNFNLNSSQGMIGLFTGSGELIDVVIYGPQAPGLSEARIPGGSERIEGGLTPTPGFDSSKLGDVGAVVLNEVMANNRSCFDPGGVLADWVELYNRSQQVADLSGCGLTDRLDQPYRWVFPSGTIIMPHGRLVVYFDSRAPSSAVNTGFGLSASGDAAYLVDKPRGGPIRVLDAVEFGIQAADFTIGRVPDGEGEWTLTLPTPGSQNTAAETGSQDQIRINEWMANPSSGGEDWLELYNLGKLPVALSGLYLTDDLSDPFRFSIPPLSYIGVGFSGYSVFLADGNTDAGSDHLNFKLSSSGESIGLADRLGRFIDSVTFGGQQSGVSEGRFPDGLGPIMAFPGGSTPGWRNNPWGVPALEVRLTPTGGVLLRWSCTPGGMFTIQQTYSIHPAQWQSLSTVEVTGNEASVVLPPRGSPSGYYRVLVIR